MVIVAAKSPSTQPAASRLQSELFKSWMPHDPQTPETIFYILKLNDVGEKVLESPMFTFWTKYLEYYNALKREADPKKKATVISAFMANYEDEDLVKILEAAKKTPSTEVLATKLQTELLKQFLVQKLDPTHVATLLNVKENTDANWKIWKSYMQDYHRIMFTNTKS